ncbi:MAG: hypothetical protein EOP37_02250 [Rubrivivax sp.]|nr:MAG: hypothetical protein EOP37_02250 [Rubrivivax sp.]
MDIKLFISAASAEFDIYREPLRHALERSGVVVKIQEHFKAGGVPTLLKLDDYIRACDAVIHLVGDACGADAPPPSVGALLERYPDLVVRVPGLAPHVGPDAEPLTYTQWEAWLAHYHRRRLFVASPRVEAPRGPRHVHDAAQADRQRRHVERLQVQEVHVEIRFSGVDNLKAQLLESPVLDLMLNARLAARAEHGDAVQAEFVRQEKRAELPVPLFRHLWRELGSRADLLGKLADAARNRTVAALAVELSAAGPDAAEGDLLRDAWRRVELVLNWEPLAAKLGLTRSRWQELAAVVADTDVRPVPRQAGLRELLLWALDLGELARALSALTQLLCLGAEAARQDSAPVTRPETAALFKALGRDDMLSPHLANALRGPPPPSGPVRLYAELELSGERPRLTRHWIQHQRSLELGEAPAPATLGEQLHALAGSVKHRGAREVQVELMAPLLLLCGQPDWTTFQEDYGGLAGLQDVRLDRDFCEEWPVSWRWRDRLEGNQLSKPADWRRRGGDISAKAERCGQLVCRFPDDPFDPADHADAHVVALPYVPPAPSSKGRNFRPFLDALLAGDPYMVWPCDEGMVNAGFKAAVLVCLAQRHVPDLPEALRQARKSGKAKHVVLFIDEPSRNPYELMGRLTAPAS